MRIGRESQMNVGMAATVAEVLDYDANAFNLDDKLAHVAQNKRKDLTVDSLAAMVDYDHLNTVGSLHFLRTLVHYVPHLHKYKPDVAKLFREDGAKLRVPVRRTVVHPLGTVGKSETATVELRDGIEDFLEQMGVTEASPPRLVFIGGDGMSFEKLLNLKYYLQFQSTPLRRFEVVEPFLEIWHTIWTNLSSIFETHWGSPYTKDPSRLGHSAFAIGQKTPSNLKKVDYYPASYEAYLIFDARVLDCWRYVVAHIWEICRLTVQQTWIWYRERPTCPFCHACSTKSTSYAR